LAKPPLQGNSCQWLVKIPPSNKLDAEQAHVLVICSVQFTKSNNPESQLMQQNKTPQ